MALKTLHQPLAMTILLTSGLALLGSWHGFAYQQMRVDQQIAVQYQQQLDAQAEYQTWLEGLQTLQPWMNLLQQGVTSNDWLTALTQWQQAHQQAWPDVELIQSQPAYNWQRYQLQMQQRINDSSDYQAWLAWQTNPFHTSLLPVQCHWQGQGHRRQGNPDSQMFKGLMACTWQLDVWQRSSDAKPPRDAPLQTLPADDLAPSLSLAQSGQLINRPVSSPKMATTTPTSVTPISAAFFSGAVTHGQQQLVNIANVWSLLPMTWCHWQITHYDGYALWLIGSAEASTPQPIALGQRLPSCERD